MLNTFIVNPAVAGIENYWDLKASHRHQWAGVNGSPVTTYLTLHGPLKKTDYPQASVTGFDPEGANPRGRAYWDTYTAPPAHAGVGVTILDDHTGPLSRFSATGTYAHHIGLAPGVSLGAGISLGAQRVSLDADKLEMQDPSDPVIAGSTELGKWKPDANVGLYLYSSQYFAGVSLQNVTSSPHLFVTGGYRIWISEDIGVLPSVMIKYIAALPVGIEVNTKFQYRDKVWLGASYRHQDGIAGMLGINVSSAFNVSYAYDYTTSSLNLASKGSHEILVGILIGNRYADLCPRNIW
jgi:type IX secretion system PorP/SprF family membrane protein